MKRYLFPAAAAALVAVLATTPDVHGQNPARWLDQDFGTNSDWNTAFNWDVFVVPSPQFYSSASLGSTVAGAEPNAVTTLSSTVTAPTVIVGDGSGASGNFTINPSGSLTTVEDLSEGDFLIGLDGGLGVVNVQGTLVVDRELQSPTSAAAESMLSLSGNASVTAEYGFLDRQLRMAGPNVSFTTTANNADGNSLILGGGGVHTWQFGASGPSQLNVNGNLDLGGTLAIETPGYTPSVGTTWTLADSVEVDANDATPSGFGFIDASGVPGLQPGAVFRVESGATGTIGVLTELTLVQEPVLTVNRQTGEVTLKNFGDADAVAFDAYTIRSANGSLAPGSLNGLADQSVSGGSWFEANPTATGVAELNPSQALTLSASQEISLGTIFSPPAPAAFGENNEDLSFDYGTPDGDLQNAQIVYEGLPNDTLVLNIDPDTGVATLLNPTSFTVDIDAYAILSDSGSLDVSGWSSLDDQNLTGGNWFEANPSATQISELLVADSLEMAANRGVEIEIGTPLQDGGVEDLVFQFALEGESFIRTGKVVYEALPDLVDLVGDANGDGVVNLLDLDILGENFGSTGATIGDGDFNGDGTVNAADLELLSQNYGATQAGGSAAVPEPVSLTLVLGLLSMTTLRRRR